MKTRIHSPSLVRILFIIALVIPLAMVRFSPARASSLSVPAAALQPASYVYAAEPQTGIDCSCTATGQYVDPAAPLPLAVQQPEYSPRGKYRVEWQYGSGQITSLSVKRVSDGHVIVWLGALPNSTYWHFSPDDDRFAIYSIETTISGSQTTYYLYNLVRATDPGSPIWDTITSLVDTEAVFSPHGQYFQYTRVDFGMTYLTILDAKTGARVYETSFNAAPPPSGSKTRVASWGYSPDPSDRTFVYAYVNSQTVSSVFWGVVNLHLTSGQLVVDELLVNAISSQTIQPFWKFSPCGDAIGLVNTAVTPTNIRLFATSDGIPLNAGGLDIMTSDTLALKNNLASHYADTGSATYTLADNTADAACSVVPGEPGLQALSISPASVVCGTGAQGTVTLSQPAPSGGVVVSLGSDTSAAQVPSSIRVLYGNSSANFTITTSEVSAETTAHISAMLGSTTNTATLTITPSPLASLTMSHYGIIAGATETGTVRLRDPAPAGGAVVYLSAVGALRTLNWVRVPEGETSATFEATAYLYVESPEAGITATYLGASKTIDLTILRASSLAVTPAEVTGGTDTVTLTVGLSGPAPEGGIAVPLSGDPAGILGLPPSVTIETGQTAGSITASTTAIDEDADITILAGMPGDWESPTAVVHVLATIPTTLPGGPYVVLAGQPITLIGTGTDPRGESLTFAWDLDFDETFETAGDTAAFTDTAGQNREVPIGFRACNTSGLCGTALTFVRVRNIGQVWVLGPEPSQDIGMPSNEIGIPDGPTPTLVEGFGQVIDVVGGAGFIAALRADGTVWTMGDNFSGQLGNPSLDTGWLTDGHRAHSSAPVRADISDVVAIASKGEHVMALKRDGTVWTWGSNRYLALGNGTADGNPHPTPTQVENLSGVVAIATSGHGSFALTRKGEIYGWGYGVNIFGRACNNTTFPCRITTIRQAVALQVTSSWAIVLKRDGTVWFWGGYDPVTMEDRLDPEQIEGLSGIKAISASGEKGSIDSTDDALLALKNDGTVWGFGNNANGQLGQDPLIPYPPYLRDYIGPVQIPGLTGTRALAAGDALQAALLQDGTVAGWGLVVHSCPEGCGEYWLPSPLAGLANVLAVAVGDDFRLAIVPGVPGAPGLAITQVSDHERVSTGDEIGFTITITNDGDDTASSVMLSDTLPLATELDWSVSGTDAASCTIAAGIVSCDLGDMPPGAVKTIRLTSPTQYTSGKGFCPTISSTATVMASNQPEGRSATTSTEVLCPYVYTSVWADTPSVTAGDPVSFTITTGNMGEGIARDVQAETTLPENPGLDWSITNSIPDGTADDCHLSNGTPSYPHPELICSFDELAAGQEVTITISSPTSFGSCGELRSGGTVTCTNGSGTRSKVATIIVNSTNCTVGDTVQPDQVATLTLPNGRGQIQFPANLVSEPTTFTYTEQDAPSQNLGSYTFAGLSFTLVATDPDGNPVTSFGASYTIRLTYQDSDWQSAGIADESLLNLAYWDTANGQWMNVLPCEGCLLDTEQNHLVAMLNHLTEFALLASTDTTPPVITTQPQSQTVYVGDAVSFSAAASGKPTPTVGWQVSTDGTTWTDIAGATASPLTFTASLNQSGNQYRAVLTNSAGSATSDAATLTVSKKPATVTLSDLIHTYDGQPKPVTVTTDPAGLSVAVTYEGSSSAPTHASSYAVAATINDATYEGSASGTLTIQPKAASVTPGAAGKVYGDADPALTGTLAGFVATDGVTAAYSRTAGEAMGVYTISAVLSPADVLANYDITYNSAACTITPRPIQVTADAKNKIAGELDPLLTYQITSGSLAFSDAFSGALTRDPGEEAGVYSILQGALALNSNYTLTYVGADLTIVAASLNTAPVANPAGPYLAAINTAISFDASGSSDAEGDTLTYAWTFGDGGTATGATPTHSYAAAGIYDACLTVNDGTEDSVPACTIAVVYDPSAGFVTGGGWIDSPAGAYKLDESLSGKATFGFVSKYKKGATVPTGTTQFQFDVAGLSFYSETYEWLVVNRGGTNAQFKGSGTVNGGMDPNGVAYKFMLWAGDGSPGTFHIRIWWEDADAAEHDVYDNSFDQPIGGGSIVVHTSK